MQMSVFRYNANLYLETDKRMVRISNLRHLTALPRPLAVLASDYPDGHWIDTHAHPWMQLVYAAGGLLRLSTTDGVWMVPPSHAVWVPAGMPHSIECYGPVAMRTLYVRVEDSPDSARRCTVVTVPSLLHELILAAVDLPLDYVDDSADGRLAAVILDRIEHLPEAPLSLLLPRDRRARRVAMALLEDPSDRRSLTDWAQISGASARTLARLFQRETGHGFSAWRQRARLQAALPMLTAGRSVTETALSLGYEQPSAFIALFRKILGQTPTRYEPPSRDIGDTDIESVVTTETG